jgi:hypothetical protein
MVETYHTDIESTVETVSRTHTMDGTPSHDSQRNDEIRKATNINQTDMSYRL